MALALVQLYVFHGINLYFATLFGRSRGLLSNAIKKWFVIRLCPPMNKVAKQ